MDDGIRILTAACVGAVVGGVWGWLYLNGSGQQVRDRVDRTLDRVLEDLRQARATGAKAKAALGEARALLTDIGTVRQSA